MAGTRVKTFLGQPLGRALPIQLTPDLLQELGDVLVKRLSKESRRYFAKRGWTGKDPAGGPPIWESFSANVRGKSTLEIDSSFYGLHELVTGDIPEREMTWLTQEAKNRHPEQFPLTEKEKRLGMKVAGKPSRGTRLPLVVPLSVGGGTVVFRVAPLTFADAWIHPGIAKFTFFEVSVKRWRKDLEPIVRKAIQRTLTAASKGRP